MKEANKKLYRSKSDKIIAGVAGGLGEYFDIDPVLIRALFVLLAFVNGLGILLYVVLMIIVPAHGGKEIKIDRSEKAKEFAHDLGEEAQKLAQKVKNKKGWLNSKRNIMGLIIVFIGIFAILNQFLPWHWLSWDWLFAVAIIVVGLLIMFKKK